MWLTKLNGERVRFEAAFIESATKGPKGEYTIIVYKRSSVAVRETVKEIFYNL